MSRCMKCTAELHIRQKCLICGWEASVPVDRTLPDVSSLVWAAWGRVRARSPRSGTELAHPGIPAWSLRLRAAEIAGQTRHNDTADMQS